MLVCEYPSDLAKAPRKSLRSPISGMGVTGKTGEEPEMAGTAYAVLLLLYFMVAFSKIFIKVIELISFI